MGGNGDGGGGGEGMGMGLNIVRTTRNSSLDAWGWCSIGLWLWGESVYVLGLPVYVDVLSIVISGSLRVVSGPP